MNNDDDHQALHELRFFVTTPHTCSYLTDRQASTLFLDPEETPSPRVYDRLTQLGFRRSGRHLYRPHCKSCNACLPVRIPTASFTPDRSQRKIINRNADLSLTCVAAGFDTAHYQLYANYINQRHADGDMYPPSAEQYRSFLCLERDDTRLMEMRLGDRLVGVCAFDILQQGLSAIYTFFDPDPELARRSLGTFAVLSLVTHAYGLGLPYLYLGYLIRESRKMAYKQNFQPLEQLDGHHWRPLNPSD